MDCTCFIFGHFAIVFEKLIYVYFIRNFLVELTNFWLQIARELICFVLFRFVSFLTECKSTLSRQYSGNAMKSVRCGIAG